MLKLKITTGIACIVFCLNSSAQAEMYKIQNPADKIKNPAEKMYNPATKIDNPAANIYNPASRMNEPNPVSPPVQALPQPLAATAESPAEKPHVQAQPPAKPLAKTAIPQKSYKFRSASAYISAAKRAFAQDNYTEFLSISEDALRRIASGTLTVSRKAEQQLIKYKAFGYGLLETGERREREELP
jgi:hypothetical protein